LAIALRDWLSGIVSQAVAPTRGQDGVVLADHGVVVAVSRDGEHRFSKTVTDEITLLPGLGVQGDAHVGS